MIDRMKLLAAAAAIVLPVAIAAQTPLTATQANRNSPRRTPTPPVEQPATPTTNTATEDAQEATTPPATAPEPVNENAEPATQTEVTTQATTPPPAEAQPTPAPVPAETQTQTAAPTPTPTPAEPTQPPTPAPADAQAQAQTQTQAGPTTVATAADVRAGVSVRDQTGGVVGTIESVDATGAVVATGTVRAKLPLTSFGRNNQGLVISLTRAQLEAAAQQATPTPS